jgi:hypothetical protein
VFPPLSLLDKAAAVVPACLRRFPCTHFHQGVNIAESMPCARLLAVQSANSTDRPLSKDSCQIILYCYVTRTIFLSLSQSYLSWEKTLGRI